VLQKVSVYIYCNALAKLKCREGKSKDLPLLETSEICRVEAM